MLLIKKVVLMHPMLNIAVKAARRAGNLIHRSADKIDHLTITRKSHSDFVSEVDRAAEQTIIQTLLDAYPTHAILAEESGSQGESEFLWIIDPLDGTTNFSARLSAIRRVHRAAAQWHHHPGGGVRPGQNELFTATRGRGAFLNDKRLRVSKRLHLADSLIGTGFPYTSFEHMDAYLAIFKELIQKTAGLRRPGSAALDLAWMAAGRYDGFFETGLKPWDMAAGCLLITEAGGMVSDLHGSDTHLKTGHICAGNPNIHPLLLQMMAPHLTAALK